MDIVKVLGTYFTYIHIFILLGHKNVLKTWSKHVCNTVIRPSHWSYMVQKQVIGVAEIETPSTLLQDTVPSQSFWSF